MNARNASKPPEPVEDRSPVDEFHIGGRIATQSFLKTLSIETYEHVLDVGCGIGGSSRFAAHTFGFRVTGVDLVKEFIETGDQLCQGVGSEQKVTLLGAAPACSHLEPQSDFEIAFIVCYTAIVINRFQKIQKRGD